MNCLPRDDLNPETAIDENDRLWSRPIYEYLRFNVSSFFLPHLDP